jgi:uncharacterized protein
MSQRRGRGFASMDPDKRQMIARLGGASVPREKRSFAQNRDLAAAAGRRGGAAVPDDRRSFSRDPQLAVEAGRKGGAAVAADLRSFSRDRNRLPSPGGAADQRIVPVRREMRESHQEATAQGPREIARATERSASRRRLL